MYTFSLPVLAELGRAGNSGLGFRDDASVAVPELYIVEQDHIIYRRIPDSEVNLLAAMLCLGQDILLRPNVNRSISLTDSVGLLESLESTKTSKMGKKTG